MRKYEGLFILDTQGKEDVLKGALERIQDDIKTAGGKVDSVQKMDHKSFARPSRQRAGGYYVNVGFQAPPDAVEKLRARFKLDAQVYRVLFTHAEEELVSGKESRGKP